MFEKRTENIKSIMCSKCENVAPVTHFSAEAVDAWKNLQEDVFCKRCAGQGVKRKELTVLHCSGECHRHWPSNAFRDEDIVQYRLDGLDEALMCIRCHAVQDQNPLMQRTHKCASCSKTKSFKKYAPINLKELFDTKRGHNRVRCEDCMYPACWLCRTRPTYPPPATAYREKKYYCTDCLYWVGN